MVCGLLCSVLVAASIGESDAPQNSKDQYVKKRETAPWFSDGAVSPVSLSYVCQWILALDGCDSGQDFAFDGFEQCAAAGGHVADFVCQSEFVDAGNRVTAANQ